MDKEIKLHALKLPGIISSTHGDHVFKEEIQDQKVQILSDNVTTVAYINHLGGQDPLFTRLTQTIFVECRDLQVDIVAKHLVGQLNSRVDFLSRIDSTYKWLLHSEMFHLLNKRWGPFIVDCFTSMRTGQIPIYNSLYRDPYTSGVDALSQDWRNQNNFINPLFCLIHKVLKKVQKEKTEVVIIAPDWPSQPWYPLMKMMLKDRPVKMPRKALLRVSSRPEPKKNSRWRIYTWRISGHGKLRAMQWEDAQIDTFMCKWAVSTLNSYNTQVRLFVMHCLEAGYDPSHVPFHAVTKFLCERAATSECPNHRWCIN